MSNLPEASPPHRYTPKRRHHSLPTFTPSLFILDSSPLRLLFGPGKLPHWQRNPRIGRIPNRRKRIIPRKNSRKQSKKPPRLDKLHFFTEVKANRQHEESHSQNDEHAAERNAGTDCPDRHEEGENAPAYRRKLVRLRARGGFWGSTHEIVGDGGGKF